MDQCLRVEEDVNMWIYTGCGLRAASCWRQAVGCGLLAAGCGLLPAGLLFTDANFNHIYKHTDNSDQTAPECEPSC